MITVIYYHDIVPNGMGSSYQKIDVDHFGRQMQYLHDQGYHPLHFSELEGNVPERSVIVSFDDGFRGVYEYAAPVMKQYGIKGNVYLPTAYIGEKPQFMTWDMVNELTDTFEFQAHTHLHTDIRTFTQESLLEEINISDALFQQHGLPLPKAFCMPYGTFHGKSVKLLQETRRYRYILGSYYGQMKGRPAHKVLPRIGISNDDSIQTFADKLHGKYNWKGPLQRLRLALSNLKKETVTEYIYD